MATVQFLQDGVTAGAARVFQVTELQRVGSGSGFEAFQPTGVEFKWSSQDYAAPRGNWTFGVKQRTVREDYPGGEEPVEQVLGWNYDPFTLAGVWDDRYAGRGFAMDTWRNFEALVKRGSFVRVQFEQVSVTGIITGAQFSYRRKDLIEYQFTVSPHFRVQGETVKEAPPGQGRLVVDPQTSVEAVRTSMDELTAAQAAAIAQASPGVLKTDLFNEITEGLDKAAAYVAQAEALVQDQILAAQDVANAMARGAQIMASVKTSAQEILNSLQGVKSSTLLAVETAGAVLDFEAWTRGLGALLRALVLGAESARRDFQTRAEPRVARLHRAKAGESLYGISTKYYGTPHQWRAIMEANGLTTLVLQGGELLAIPEAV